VGLPGTGATCRWVLVPRSRFDCEGVGRGAADPGYVCSKGFSVSLDSWSMMSGCDGPIDSDANVEDPTERGAGGHVGSPLHRRIFIFY
jgi:hypothetical protein